MKCIQRQHIDTTKKITRWIIHVWFFSTTRRFFFYSRILEGELLFTLEISHAIFSTAFFGSFYLIPDEFAIFSKLFFIHSLVFLCFFLISVKSSRIFYFLIEILGCPRCFSVGAGKDIFPLTMRGCDFFFKFHQRCLSQHYMESPRTNFHWYSVVLWLPLPLVCFDVLSNKLR